MWWRLLTLTLLALVLAVAYAHSGPITFVEVH